MRRVTSPITFATLTLILVYSPAYPGDIMSCVFNTHGPSVAFIEYKYRSKDGYDDLTKGSGFIIFPDGHMLTNNHVLSPTNEADGPVKQESVTVHLGSIRSAGIPAIIVSRDPSHDLALIKIDAATQPWPSLTLGDSTQMKVGDLLTGLGFPGGDLTIVPTAPITARNTIIHNESKPWWQTALSLNPGNSGGPVFDALGTVVGIAVAYNEDAQRISYVLPLQYALGLAQQGGAKPVLAGPCATFPVCSRPEHGIDHYAIDVKEGRWSDWRGGGYNRSAYCGDLLQDLQKEHPAATFNKVTDNEDQRVTDKWPNLRHAEYRYYCEYRITEGPVFKESAGPECLNR